MKKEKKDELKMVKKIREENKKDNLKDDVE